MRLTITRSTWNKLLTHMNKPLNVDVAPLLAKVKYTYDPKKNTILWDVESEPVQAFLKRVQIIWARECVWVRKPDGCSAKALTVDLAAVCKLTGATPEALIQDERDKQLNSARGDNGSEVNPGG